MTIFKEEIKISFFLMKNVSVTFSRIADSSSFCVELQTFFMSYKKKQKKKKKKKRKMEEDKKRFTDKTVVSKGMK